jgi:predicted secreted protein
VSRESIRIRRGETFEVALREPAAAGYRWRRADATQGVALIDERYEAPRPGGPLGAAGRRIATLRADGAGHYRLRFVLARPWEAAPDDEHHVEVDAF